MGFTELNNAVNNLNGCVRTKKDNGPFASASALEHARQNGYAHLTT